MYIVRFYSRPACSIYVFVYKSICSGILGAYRLERGKNNKFCPSLGLLSAHMHTAAYRITPSNTSRKPKALGYFESLQVARAHAFHLAPAARHAGDVVPVVRYFCGVNRALGVRISVEVADVRHCLRPGVAVHVDV